MHNQRAKSPEKTEKIENPERPVKPKESQESELRADLTSSRDRLKNSAVKLFAQYGLEGVSTRDLAREADVNIGLITYYFKNKEGLYRTTVCEYMNEIINKFSIYLDEFSDKPITRENYKQLMREAMRALIQLKIDSPEMHIILMREMLSGMPYLSEMYHEMFEKIIHRFIFVVEQAQVQKIVRQDIHAHTLLFTMSHSMDSFFCIQKCSEMFPEKILSFPEESEKLLEQFTKIFVEGVML